jgi:hypothetical protein
MTVGTVARRGLGLLGHLPIIDACLDA